MSNFNELYSQCYNLLYADKDYGSEVDYVHGLIHTYSPSTKSILDLGCGTGNHDFLLLDKGYAVQGVDLSETMVHEAINRAKNEKKDSRISFTKGDVRSIDLNRKFDAVLSLFHVLSYQTMNKDVLDVFKTSCRHLNNGGIFVFDCWYGPAVLSDKPVKKVKSVENESISVERTTIPEISYRKNIVDVNFYMNVLQKSTGNTEKFHELHSMRYFFDTEIEFFAHEAGYKIEDSFKWMSKEIPSENSWYVVYILRK